MQRKPQSALTHVLCIAASLLLSGVGVSRGRRRVRVLGESHGYFPCASCIGVGCGGSRNVDRPATLTCATPSSVVLIMCVRVCEAGWRANLLPTNSAGGMATTSTTPRPVVERNMEKKKAHHQGRTYSRYIGIYNTCKENHRVLSLMFCA